MALRLAAFVWAFAVLSAQDQQKEAALGASLAGDIRQHTTSIDSAIVHDYVDQLGRRLSEQLPGTGFSYTFTVIQDAVGGRTHEPISLPGGYVFIPGSLIFAARSEAEFAGMLAHAMAHVAARHGTRLATRGAPAKQASIPLIYMGGWNGSGDALFPIGFLSTQRSYELEADRLAVRITAGAGFDPGALLRYVERVQPANTDMQPMRSPLPSLEQRTAEMEQAIQDLPARTYSASDGIRAIQAELRRVNP